MGAVHQKDEQSETDTSESFQLGLAWYGKSQTHWRKQVELDLYEATAYLPINLHSSNQNLIVAVHNSLVKAKIIGFFELICLMDFN